MAVLLFLSLGLGGPATCRPDACFCEAVRDDAIAQPANTWSSFGFVIAGLAIAHTRPRKTQMDVLHRRMFGYALVFTGLGSAFYHASLTFAGQVLDVSGMYVLMGFALLYSMSRIWQQSRMTFLWTYLGMNAALLWLQVYFAGARRYVFAILVILVLGTEIYLRKRTGISVGSKWLWRAAGIMAVAFVIWILDITKMACAPKSVVQGHAIWHLLGAVSAVCLYRYYLSGCPATHSTRNADAGSI